MRVITTVVALITILIIGCVLAIFWVAPWIDHGELEEIIATASSKETPTWKRLSILASVGEGGWTHVCVHSNTRNPEKIIEPYMRSKELTPPVLLALRLADPVEPQWAITLMKNKSTLSIELRGRCLRLGSDSININSWCEVLDRSFFKLDPPFSGLIGCRNGEISEITFRTSGNFE